MDNCEKCTARGNIVKCINTECSMHSSWIVQFWREKYVEANDTVIREMSVRQMQTTEKEEG